MHQCLRFEILYIDKDEALKQPKRVALDFTSPLVMMVWRYRLVLGLVTAGIILLIIINPASASCTCSTLANLLKSETEIRVFPLVQNDQKIEPSVYVSSKIDCFLFLLLQ